MTEETPTEPSALAYERAADAAPATEEPAYEPLADDDYWPEESDELPPRQHRRLFGAGANRVALALLGVLLLAGGFISGVLVEKGETSSTGSAGAGAAGLASRFAALRGGGGGGSSTTAGKAAAGGFPRAAGGAGAFGGAGATVGEVSFVSGSTLYVTDAEGATVKVKVSPGSSITKTVKAALRSIHPGETVVVRGAKRANGAVSAESISVGGAGAADGGIASLFGGGGAGSSGDGGGSSSTGGGA